MLSVIKFLDKRVGNLLCNLLGLFNRQKSLNGSKNDRILVVQLWGIGETILTLPAIDSLRKKFPEAEINVLATPRNRDVFFGNGNISNIVSVKLNPFSVLNFILKNMKKYDLVVDMEEYLNISAIISFFSGRRRIGYSHNSRAKLYTNKVRYNDKQHAVQTFLDLTRSLGIDYATDKLPKLSFSRKDKNAAEKFLSGSKIKADDYVICVAPGAAESAKSRIWPHDRYAELCDEIISRHKDNAKSDANAKSAKIIFVGVLNESELIESIQKGMENRENTVNSAGKLTLNQLFCLISKSKLFIGNDAGPMHIAAAQGVKTLGLFGPNVPIRFGPYGKGNIGLYKGNNCEFSPCINVHKGEVPDCLYPKNSNDYQKCMKNISVDDALKEAERLG